ncbi:MAG: hypothetical protein V1792_27975 [Pseudomonadota bacterium]
MNTFDSILPLRRMPAVHGPTIFEAACNRYMGSTWKLPAFRALCCRVLIVSISLLMVSGCGRYKEVIENAKQQIDKLNAQVERLTEETSRLNQDKSRLSDQLKTLSEKTERIQREFEDLNKTKASLAAENKEMRKKDSGSELEIASLKNEKTRLTQEVEELKKRLSQSAPPPESSEATPSTAGMGSPKPQEQLSPCDAVIAFIKASEAVVRQQRGTERTRLLEQVKQQFAPKMKGAPEKAIKAAEDWVKEGTKFWDKPDEDSTFRLLRLRNTVLQSCGRSPDEAGFK